MSTGETEHEPCEGCRATLEERLEHTERELECADHALSATNRKLEQSNTLVMVAFGLGLMAGAAIVLQHAGGSPVNYVRLV